MHYIVDGGLTYDGAPEFRADGTLVLPNGQALAEGIGWRKVDVLAGEPTPARKMLSDRAKDLADRRRRHLPRR
jgi:hypothetical protein